MGPEVRQLDPDLPSPETDVGEHGSLILRSRIDVTLSGAAAPERVPTGLLFVLPPGTCGLVSLNRGLALQGVIVLSPFMTRGPGKAIELAVVLGSVRDHPVSIRREMAFGEIVFVDVRQV